MSKTVDQPFLPVIIQSGQYAYGVARSFYEAYRMKSLVLEPSMKTKGIRTLLLGGALGIATQNSDILDFQYVDRLDEPDYFVQALIEVAKQFKHKKLILLVCDCYYAELIITNKQTLQHYFILPYIDEGLMKRVQTKEEFYKQCDLYNLKYPQTIVLTKEHHVTSEIPFDYPIIIKPSNFVEYSRCSFPEKKKVFLVKNEEEKRHIIKSIYRSSYKDSLILQEFIPGDDSYIRVLDVYVGKDRKVKLMCLGNKLLEDPSPQNIGISLAIMTDFDKQLMDNLRYFLEGIGYSGFANFDMKLDVRDGEFKIFEMNLRSGASSYYVTASGHNLMQCVANDYVFNVHQELTYVQTRHLWSLIPKRLLFKGLKNVKLKIEAKQLIKQDKYSNALYFREDMNIKRWVKLKLYNFYLNLKYKKYYK
ncbi:ATP-grasp domain-containing protein [Lysinibacillus sp. KCTC 33748]|uniref:carboxylate--amine ligase n=1 Tax=unclassified Lysinibacillus TaxID=2636778 RepID=UPI0009A6803A|nr:MULTISPECIES: ATP-grasp domain-containing protein [unclassified Lysinibacillus]OXS75397.1 ATP-grasp domain-containing protein [Lysinibacillus sp. KCTC 33748]SKB52522.1 D-aspartate ligase [Lysinibacillus sp. AC-3]